MQKIIVYIFILSCSSKIITMKNLMILGIFILIMVFVQFAQAQTVDEVIEKNVAAMGGKEKLATLNSVRLQGGMNVQGAEVAITQTKLHMTGMRMDISVMGSENYQIATPSTGWVFMPVFGQSAPQTMPADKLKAEQIQLDLHGILVDYKQKEIAVELQGKETVEGVECYKIKATFKNGNITNFYIDTKTDRLYKMVTLNGGDDADNFVIYSNYKQNADGYWFAYTITNSRGDLNYDKIETNIKVEESLFK